MEQLVQTNPMTCHWIVGATSSCKESVGFSNWVGFEYIESKYQSDRVGRQFKSELVVIFQYFETDAIK